MKFKRVIFATACALVCAACVARDFSVGTGALVLDVDESWRQAQAPRGSGAALYLEAADPQRAVILVTPIPLSQTDAQIREMVQSRAKGVGAQAVEKTTVQRIEGPNARGYYFKATDPAPKPGEHVYMYQGIVGGLPASATFTILFNPGAEKEAAAALAAIGTLRIRAPQ